MKSKSSPVVKLFFFFSALTGSCKAQEDNSGLAIFIPVFVVLVVFSVYIIFIMICVTVCCIKSSSNRTGHTNGRYAHNGQRVHTNVQNCPVQSYPVQTHGYPQANPIATETHEKPQEASLPEATLHKGDAPPGYKEAIKMTAVNIAS